MAKKAQNKTTETDASVDAFLAAVEDETRRAEGRTLCDLMREVTGLEPKMWGPSMVGFGSYHYRYESGREGDMFLVGFSPRKAALSLYLTNAVEEVADLLPKFGKHTTGKACIYVKSLSDVDLTVLRKMIARAIKKAGGK